MAYWPPKTNWVTTDGIGYDDLNFIGEQSESVAAAIRRVHGFGFGVDNSQGGYDGLVTVLPGGCFSENGAPIRMAANHVKSLATWAAGNGAAYGGMASAVTVAAHTWYYMFVVMNPADGSTEIIFDDNIAGTNVAADVGSYTEKRYIGAFKTAAAGGSGSFDLVEMYSLDGDNVVFNPNSLEPVNFWFLTLTNTGIINNNYQAVTLTSAGIYGLALPAKNVRAKLLCGTGLTPGEVFYGMISQVAAGGNPVFTDPGSLFATPPSSAPRAEQYYAPPVIGTTEDHTEVFDIHVNASGQLLIAMWRSGGGGELRIAVRGYYDDRIV